MLIKMIIQCDCAKFKAELVNFKGNNPGRLVCYCDDCQNYLQKLGRQDLLDPYGGTEVIPVYPCNFKIVQGYEFLRCNILKEKGLYRWSVTCCNTPVLNTMPKFPWAGVFHKLYSNSAPEFLMSLGGVRSRIKGKFKTSEAPFPISDNLNLKDGLAVLPFLLKGFIFKKYKNSPFFKSDNVTPSKNPELL